MSKNRDRSHLRLVTAAPHPDQVGTPVSDGQTQPILHPTQSTGKPLSSKIHQLIQEVLTQSMVRVCSSVSSEERVKFTCSQSGAFGWIMIIRADANTVVVRSNDAQMDIGKPFSFYRAGKREEAHGFMVDIMEHLCTYVGHYVNLKIQHEIDPAL